MAQRSPIVIVNGRLSELQPGDSVAGSVLGNVTASSGLVGGGDLNTGSKRLDLALAPVASGLIFADDAIASDGVSLVSSQVALASGVAAQVTAQSAISGSNQALSTSLVAVDSGNAALQSAVQSIAYSNSVNFTTSSTVVPGDVVSINSAGSVQKTTVTSQSVSIQANTPVSFSKGQPVEMRFSPETNTGVCLYGESTPSGASWRARPFTVNQSQATFGIETSGTLPIISGVHPAAQLGYNPQQGTFFAIGADSTNLNYPTARAFTVVSGATQIQLGRYTTWGTTAIATGIYSTATIYDDRFNVMQTISQRYAVCTDLTPQYSNYTGTTTNALWVNPSTTPTTSWTASSGNILAAEFHKHAGSGIVLVRNGSRADLTDVAVTRVLPTYAQDTGPNIVLLSGQQVSTATTTYSGLQIDSPRGLYCPSIKKVLFVFEQDNLANDPGGCFFCDIVSGVTSPSGAWVQFDPLVTFASGCQYPVATWDSYNEKVFIAYRDTAGSNFLAANVGTISGVSSSGHVLSISPKYILLSSDVTYVDAAFVPSIGKNIVSFYNNARASGELAVIDNLVTNTYSTRNVNNQNNFVGITQQAASSGSTVDVLFPKATSTTFSGLLTGSFYWLDAASGALTVDSRIAPNWSGAVDWRPIGRAVSSSGLFILNSL